VSRKLTGIGHLRIISALEKANFVIVRQGKHVVMKRGNDFLTIPRHNPLKRFTLEGIIKDAGMTIDEFLDLL
jgi:predicted RNA binding protein YcfA (HicA-like mRNA interferase family)